MRILKSLNVMDELELSHDSDTNSLVAFSKNDTRRAVGTVGTDGANDMVSEKRGFVFRWNDVKRFSWRHAVL